MEIREARSVEAEETVGEALKQMAHESERELFVTEKGELVGVVTLRSLIDARSPLKTKVKGTAFMPMQLKEGFDPVDALEFMIKTGLDALPVVEDGKLVGEVGLDDLLKKLEPKGKVIDHMTADPITVEGEMPVSKAKSVMRNYGIHRLLVSEDGVHLDGIVTASDIVRNVLVPIGKTTRGEMKQEKSSRYSTAIGSFMTKNVVSIRPDETAAEAMKRMLENDVKALPVVEGGELVGIVTKRRIAKTLLPKAEKGAWVRMTGTEDLDYFSVSLIHKVVRQYVQKLGRKESFDEVKIIIKEIKESGYEIKVGLVAEGKRLRTTSANGFDPVVVVAEALRKLERSAEK